MSQPTILLLTLCWFSSICRPLSNGLLRTDASICHEIRHNKSLWSDSVGMDDHHVEHGKVIRVLQADYCCRAVERNASSKRDSHTALPEIDAVLMPHDTLAVFLSFLYGSRNDKENSIDLLAGNWDAGYIPLLIDILYLIPDQWLISKLSGLLEKHTNEAHGTNYFEWLQWLWRQDPGYQHYYSDFKAELYRHIDQRFETYFRKRHHLSEIRLDEVVWGGVPQDGIPPLRNPEMIESHQENYLSNNDVVFGVYIDGEARAYPKRILAWHEFFTDRIGGVDIAGVYCTLCGTVIAYDTEYDGVKHKLGTSGFLYRSNKLMYDEATQSLWSTIKGRPVIGPLIDQDITLKSYPVVTTTWENWKKRHPQTLVLSQHTGHDRNYGEGVAYRQYFATDRLMFPVPKQDSRLKNKDEVLIIRAPGYENDPLAISIEFLKKRKIHQGKVAQTPFVVLTEKGGASRVFQRESNDFRSYRNGVLLDGSGNEWTIDEDKLMDAQGNILRRLPSHQIFWFGWINTYPQTRLTK